MQIFTRNNIQKLFYLDCCLAVKSFNIKSLFLYYARVYV